MSHPNHREMDVARSLIDMAHIPETGTNTRNHINTNLGMQAHSVQQPQHAVRDQKPLMRAGHDQRKTVGQNLHPYLAHHHHPYQNPNPPSHPATPTPMPRPYGAAPPAPAAAAAPIGGQRTLQDHLFRQQLLAGIEPENIISIPQRPQGVAERQGTPALLQISNDGVFVPRVPPATFIPRTPYPVPPGEYDSRGNTPTGQGHGHAYGQFLNVPVHHPRPTFERERPPPASVFGQFPNVLGDGHSLGRYGTQGFYARSSLNANAMYQSTGYAHGAYMPPQQGYFQRHANAFNPTDADYGNASYTIVKNEPDADAQQYMLGYGHTSNFVKNEPEEEAQRYMLDHPMHASSVVKNEPEDDTQQFMLCTPVHNFDAVYHLHARNLHANPNHKYGSHPTAFQPDPIDRTPVSYERQGYTDMKSEDDETPIQDEKTSQLVDQRSRRLFMTKTRKRHSAASQSAEMSIKKEPGSEDEQMIDPIINEDVSVLNGDIKPTKDKPMTRVDSEQKANTVNGHHIFIALLDHRELALNITKNLDVPDLINLQAASRDARTFIIKNLPKVIRLQTLRARTASFLFPWRCYQRLWFKRFLVNDEVVPFLLPNPAGVFAYTASFRWLQMIKSRDTIVHNIITALHNAGYGFPRRYKAAIYKLWFLMDIPDTRRRQWTVSNRNLWTDLDLFMAIFFIVRIDMFVKIQRGNKTGGQRRLIMAQPTLKFCHDVLTGQALRNDMELLAAHIRWHYSPRPGEVIEQEGAFGVPANEIGSLQYEGYGEGRARMAKLRRPDAIVLREASRRRLDFQGMYRRIFIYAQPGAYTACERPNSVWDEEMKIRVRGTGVPLHDVVRLD
ncbi:uncharacterized protein BDV17DRAFT_290379 [Aspergillus undulatus]|uniref:uncharacterized protein n=1 Tax=Aspergillus undulatus TaxID=1810928 RepID=UPI003CCD14AD